MDLNEYQKLSKRTMPKRSDDEQTNLKSVANYGLGLVAESGEVADLIKKELFHGHEIDPEEMLKELGDVFHYLAGVSLMYGFTLNQVAEANIEKLLKRYPNGFSKEDSVNRIE